MQDQFKERMLAYFVGQYQTESGNENLRVAEEEMLSSNDIYTTLGTLTNAYVKGRITDKDNKCLIFYGSYGMSQTYYDGHGFILTADFNGNVIELFTTYEGGTALPNIEYLTYAEDGTFYGITTNTSGTSYLTQFNNFTLTLTGTYSVKYRQTYQLGGDLQNANVVNMKVKKKIGEGKYVFVAQRGSNPSAITTMIVSTVEIVVGGENTWSHQTYSTNIKYFSGHENGLGIFISWLNDDYYVKIGGVNASSGKYMEYYIKNSEAATTYTSSITESNFTVSAKGGIVMPTYEATYVGDTDGTYFYIYKVVNATSTSLIYQEETGNPGGYSYYLKLVLSENKIYFAYSCTYDTIGTLGLIDNDNIYEIGNIEQGIYEYTELYSSSQFNMNNIYVDNPNIDLEKFVLIYNAANYIGTDYQALNSMVANSGILYDENDKIIFARNLYNKVINANTTESTIQVPNIYLNDTTIETQNLISQTNSILNINEQSISKNIYESLFINFFNVVNMSNQNDPNNIIINTPGASKLNISVSNSNNDYNNAKIGTIRVNYSDDTTYTLPAFTTIKQNNKLYTIEFTIYVSKAIDTIDIMSADGTVVYQTITPSIQLELEKFYKITQDVKIV